MAKQKRKDGEARKTKKLKKEKKEKKSKKKKKSQRTRKDDENNMITEATSMNNRPSETDRNEDGKELKESQSDVIKSLKKVEDACSSSDESSFGILPSKTRKASRVARNRLSDEDSALDESDENNGNDANESGSIESSKSNESLEIITSRQSRSARTRSMNNESSDIRSWFKSPRSTKSSTVARKNHLSDSSDDDDENLISSDIQRPIAKSPIRKSPRISNASTANTSTVTRMNNLSDSSDDDENSVSSNHQKPIAKSPIRKSPRRSNASTANKIRKMSEEIAETEYSDQDDDDEIRTFKATKKQKENDDDAYHEEDEGDNEDNDSEEFDSEERDLFNDEISSEEDSDNESDIEESLKCKAPEVKNIDNDIIFDEEGDSDGDDMKPNNSVELTPLKMKRKRGQFSYDDSSDGEEIVATPIKHSRSEEMPMRRFIPVCPSVNDEITSELLPSLHVCYLAPDRVTRHCFCLDTIYRASIMSGQKQRKSDGSGGIAFLQPPHFRTVMNDELIDQIASRFGRQALVIEKSDVYKKEHKLPLKEDWSFGEDNIDMVDEAQESFRDRLDRYLKDQMGSGDIYCCPICYHEAQRRSGGEDSEDDDENDNDDDPEECEYAFDDVTSFKTSDPLSILGYLDNDDFEVASTFCFSKLSYLKQHIRSVHDIDISEVEINDFLKKFAIRAQDGLLQSYLRAYYGNRVFTGAMRKYWYGGHNQSYILLKVLIEDRQYRREGEIGDNLNEFSRSFPIRSKEIWKGLSAPFSKSIDPDFIEDEENEESVDVYQPTFNQPEFSEETFAAELREKRANLSRARRKKHGYDSSSDGSSDSSDSDESDDDKSSSSDEDEDEIIEVGEVEYESEEGSSEDEWMKKRRRKPKHRNSRLKSKKGKSSLSSDDDDSLVFDGSKNSTNPSTKKTDFDDSSSDESIVDSPETKKHRTPSKVTIMDSDEE